ncbi:MAG: winged helix-turn-helix transcriptional regulator [Phycisphaerae bacterium]|nr:winged helix-turn-helix transcriptional regulator [Phycisphaerae bacterium]
MKMSTTNLVFRAFADETRLRILNLLLDGEMCVCDLCEVLGVLQPRISRHLGYLTRAGLVSVRQEGKWKHYSLVEKPGRLHSSLLSCVRGCLNDIEILKDDRRTLRKRRSRRCCANDGRCLRVDDNGSHSWR